MGNCSVGRSYPEVHAQCQETSQNGFHECCFLQVVAFYRWLSLTVCRGWVASARSDSSLQLSSCFVRTEALTYRSIAHVQRLARPLFADDKRVHFKNQSWEIQKDHETYKKLRMLGSRSSRCPLKTVKLENGELTATEPPRQKFLQSGCMQVASGPRFSHQCFAGQRLPRRHQRLRGLFSSVSLLR